MKIRIISAHCIGNGRDVWPGEVLEVDPKLGAREIGKGFAVAAGADETVTTERVAKPVDVAASAPAVEPEKPETGEESAEPETELPAGGRRGRRQN